jgi:prepilin-type N-terminal cleavage/methylation domain-containing protein
MKNFTKKTGFTLVELLIATTILTIIFTVVMTVFANFTGSKRKLLLSTEIYDETRFLLERIVNEVHNGTIDYQGYWRENIMIDYNGGKIADIWIEEGVNPQGAKANGTAKNDKGFNAVKNCGKTDFNATTDNSNDNKTDIIKNYRYQFIHPGTLSDKYNNNQNVLNCPQDDQNDISGYNIYDDETALGQGPRSLSEFPYNKNSNQAYSKKMLWSWDLSEDAETDNNPPLMLVRYKSVEDVYERTALRYNQKEKTLELIRFVTDGSGDLNSPIDGIPETWKCMKDFLCNNKRDGSYLWNGFGGGNMIYNSISDSNLNWENITPEKIEILDFGFILSPVKDPHRSFYEKERIQKPQVTIFIKAQATDSSMRGVKGKKPVISLQTTATPRVWDLIEIDN